MPSMTRPCLSSLLLVIFYCCANAKRVGRETETLGENMVSHVQEHFWDITEDLGHLKDGYKCCCDKQSENDNGRGIDAESRANYCVIAQVSKCYHVKVVPETPSAHTYNKVGDNTCVIAQSGLSAFLGAMDGKPEYCRSFPAYEVDLGGKMTVELPAAAFGATVEAPCPDGSKGTVTCLEGTSSYGKWSAVSCDTPWCPKVHPSSDGLPTIQPATVGGQVLVACQSGQEAKPRSVKCTESGFEHAMCHGMPSRR